MAKEVLIIESNTVIIIPTPGLNIYFTDLVYTVVFLSVVPRQSTSESKTD